MLPRSSSFEGLNSYSEALHTRKNTIIIVILRHESLIDRKTEAWAPSLSLSLNVYVGQIPKYSEHTQHASDIVLHSMAPGMRRKGAWWRLPNFCAAGTCTTFYCLQVFSIGTYLV
jgi:hypothetical protein